jgi:DNA-binding LacI/PurR family transcriptional regulator
MPSRLAASTYSVQHRRIAGTTAVLADAGIGATGVPVEEVPANDRDAGREAGHALLDRHPDLTAIVCTSDLLALGVLQAARERGVRVPEDLSVSGYDGIPEAAEAGLTTIQQPLVEKGRIAGELLLGFRPEDARRRQVLPAQLRIRRTTGPVPR